MDKKIIIISGATASGKSSLALKIAAKYNGIIINADSAQIYDHISILSSQPSKDDKLKSDHLLYSFIDPLISSKRYSVVDWIEDVKNILKNNENRVSVIVGGTGLYLSKLIDGIAVIPQILDETRERARSLFLEIGEEKFKQSLIDLGEDETSIKNLDKVRLIRNFEVITQTKKSIYWWRENHHTKGIDPSSFIHINLNPDREIIYKNCEIRLNQMFLDGAVEEVKFLLDSNLDKNSPIKGVIGFSDIEGFLKGYTTKSEAFECTLKKTRNYAKRQVTWFKHQFSDKHSFSLSIEAENFLKNL